MPHSRRKKSIVSHNKYRAIEGEDGWTVVIKGQKHATPPNCTPPVEAVNPDDLSETVAKFQAAMTRLDDCDWHGQLLANGIASADASISITNCVCIGLGRTDYPTDRPEKIPRAMNQLAAIEGWLKVLEERFQWDRVKISAYDPAYRDVDVEYLQGRGHIVPKTASDNFSHLINENTLLFAPYCTWTGIFDRLMQPNGTPAIYIGNNATEKLSHMTLEPQFSQAQYDCLQAFVDNTVNVPFLAFERHHDSNCAPCRHAALEGLEVRVRKAQSTSSNVHPITPPQTAVDPETKSDEHKDSKS